MGTADSNNRGEIQPEVEELQGDRRRPLEKEALESEKVQFVADRIGTQGKVASAFRYSLQSGTTGYGVTIGVDAAAEEPIISYYESDAFADGTAVVGGKPAGDGYLVVDADTKQVFHVHGTPQLNEAVKMLPRNEAYSEFRQQLAEGTVQENEAIMVQGFEDGETRTDILLPIAHNNNNNIDRLAVSGSGTPTDASIDRYSVASSSDVNGPVQNQVAPCGPICGVLTVAGAGACLGVCVSNPITAPYASYCGQLCAAATIGTCIPTCNDIL